jgi:tripartite-type tricarboxylate transporter receptor subunit TctC
VAGRIDFMFDAMPSSLPFVKDKRLRALAIEAPKRSALLPDVPTLVELGLTGYEASPWFDLAAPTGTPALMKSDTERPGQVRQGVGRKA